MPETLARRCRRRDRNMIGESDTPKASIVPLPPMPHRLARAYLSLSDVKQNTHHLVVHVQQLALGHRDLGRGGIALVRLEAIVVETDAELGRKPSAPHSFADNGAARFGGGSALGGALTGSSCLSGTWPVSSLLSASVWRPRTRARARGWGAKSVCFSVGCGCRRQLGILW